MTKICSILKNSTEKMVSLHNHCLNYNVLKTHRVQHRANIFATHNTAEADRNYRSTTKK